MVVADVLYEKSVCFEIFQWLDCKGCLLDKRFCYHPDRTVARKFSIGGLCFSAVGFGFVRGAWHSKNWQNLNWFVVFHFSIWGAWSFVWGAKPPKPPSAMGLHPEGRCGFSSAGSSEEFSASVTMCGRKNDLWRFLLLVWSVCEFTQKLSLDDNYCFSFRVVILIAFHR